MIDSTKEKKMVDINRVLKYAKDFNASDVHLVPGRRPTVRIARELKEIEEEEVLTESDMYEIYDYFIRGNIDRDEIYSQTRQLDISHVFDDIRLRVNISSFDEIPIFTMRLIKNELPRVEELGVPDVVRRTMFQPQGLILVTGKTNSGKTTTLNALIDEVNQNPELSKLLSKHVFERIVLLNPEKRGDAKCICL